MKGYRYVIGVLLLFACLSTQAQKFFNLTADDVRIDSVLPRFAYAMYLGDNYADSIYEVSIKYPEYIDMSKADIERYQEITDEPLPDEISIGKQIVLDRRKGKLEISFVPLVMRSGKPQILVSFMLDVQAKSAKRAVRKANARKSSATSSRYASSSVLSSGKWAKIRVPANGVYQLTSSLIKQAGFSDLSRVKVYGYGGNLQNEVFDGDELTELDDLKEVPTCTINGRRLFYGRGPVNWESNDATRRTRNPYSDYGYYFLTENEDEPLSIDSTTFVSSFYPSADDYHALHEVDNYAWYHGGRNLFESSPIQNGASKIYTLSNTARATSGTLSVCITAGVNSTASIEINDSLVGTLSVSIARYYKGNETRRTYNVSNLQATDSIKITTTSGGPVRLDYISMAYDTPRNEPKLSTGNFAVPEYVYNITNQNHHADSQADMVIIIPTSQKLRSQAQRLADFHATHDSLRVNIVPADELYNEFSSGTPDPNAYRRYMKMLYDRAENEADMPKYLLLFGDCVWDNRMLTSDCRSLDADDYLLAFESENSFHEIYCYVSDDFFGLLDDGERLTQGSPPNEQALCQTDVAVGRFPVVTETDAKTMVDKTISYAENKNAGDWQNVIMFLGDDGNQNLHMRDLDATAETIAGLYPGYQIKKVMWDAYTRETSSTGNTYPEVTSIIKQQQAAGALIMDYAGHGSETQISHETALSIGDFKNFTNTNLPLWVTASCDIMPFDGVSETIGEEAVLNKKGGAVAFYGTTRTVYAAENAPLNTAFMKHVLSLVGGKPITIGEAQRRAKNEMITTGRDRSTNKLQYSLLGDPALTLNLPTLQAVIDEIDGKPLGSSEMPVLKAGATTTVKGHIVRNNLKDETFQGKMTATVRDTRELITCKQNDPVESRTAFTFYDRQKTLFNGSDSVRNGDFSFTFAVPRDINYADGTGLINVYAVNNALTLRAHGAEDGFYINGSEEIRNDSIGPSIYCYLNTPSFVNGGDVNCTPYFVANITDKDGINATGNGIGHDLELIIDGDMTKTYNLNGNFTYDFGSYTSGSTYYNIPELEPGAHTLKFRAWDILNNSSTAVLNFNVVRGLQPEIMSVSCTNNPATTTTTFIVTHNYTGSNVDVELSIFDMSGRELWRHSESGVSTGANYTMDWDLTIDGGRRLQTGVYLYRVRISSDGSSKASKAKKLIVINN
ncbi:MAG: type IX secretion system sortase PorU [Prevotella sp.]|nr:type IX secretion system sortase PorU [Prevotella sp.]